MDIRNVDTRGMIIDPKDKNVVSLFATSLGHKTTDYKALTLPAENVVKYILLMYDPKSPMHQYVDDYWGKKYECVEAAGFKIINKKFDKSVDDMLVGKIEKIDDMILEFLSFVSKPQWSYITFLNESLMSYVGGSLKGKEINSTDIKVVSELHSKQNDAIRDWLYIKDDAFETKQFIEKIYKKVHHSRNGVRPEDYAKRLASGDTLKEDNPYGEKYKVQKIRFVGSSVPKNNNDEEE